MLLRVLLHQLSLLRSLSPLRNQALKSVIGFDLNGSTDPSSLLGSLSLAPANDGAEDAGSSIWGGSSLAPGPASLPGFRAPGADQASSTAGDPVGDEGCWIVEYVFLESA